MIHLPTLRQLSYLVALADQGHFGKAAEACFVTQSTLSAGIAELEKLMDVVLVERTRRVVRFTPLGLNIVEKARQILHEADELANMARAGSRPLSGAVRMAVIPTIAPFLLPKALPRLRKAWPELKLYLREETSQAACESLRRGQVDCVLLALPFDCGNVDSAAICDDPLLLAVPADALPGHQGAIDPDDIVDAKLLLLEDGHCLKDHALAVCNRPAAGSDTTMLGTSLHTLVQMVANGLGLTMVPKMAVDAGILSGAKVRALAIAAEDAKRHIALVWRRSSPRAREFTLLAEALRGRTEPQAVPKKRAAA